jgi:hypothetical protein
MEELDVFLDFLAGVILGLCVAAAIGLGVYCIYKFQGVVLIPIGFIAVIWAANRIRGNL